MSVLRDLGDGWSIRESEGGNIIELCASYGRAAAFRYGLFQQFTGPIDGNHIAALVDVWRERQATK